ncbi:uncharacterized protein LOC115686109 [Syzygium oleosum]|uniref:uncharacterized protein LOC115686109 n=1 Tax=Syzygium oleosum TaxID=219896 RepID=UPI0024BA34F0|nr:uncharacterized protein LOC115686109 [Syzygium oleosum]
MPQLTHPDICLITESSSRTASKASSHDRLLFSFASHAPDVGRRGIAALYQRDSAFWFWRWRKRSSKPELANLQKLDDPYHRRFLDSYPRARLHQRRAFPHGSPNRYVAMVPTSSNLQVEVSSVANEAACTLKTG